MWMDVCEAAREGKCDLLLLFGSQARRTAGPDSDVDVAILATQRIDDLGPLGQALGSHNLDVVWLEEASWLLWQEAFRDGIPLYQRTPNLFLELRLESLLRSWDSDIWRERNRRFVERMLREGLALNRDLVERKLALMAQYVGELKPILELPQSRFVQDPMVHHAAERIVELLVECAASINTEVSQSLAGTPPSDYYSSFFSLASTGWIEPSTARALADWARLRNTLVHRYESVGLDELYMALQKSPESWSKYLNSVRDGLSRPSV